VARIRECKTLLVNRVIKYYTNNK